MQQLRNKDWSLLAANVNQPQKVFVVKIYVHIENMVLNVWLLVASAEVNHVEIMWIELRKTMMQTYMIYSINI